MKTIRLTNRDGWEDVDVDAILSAFNEGWLRSTTDTLGATYFERDYSYEPNGQLLTVEVPDDADEQEVMDSILSVVSAASSVRNSESILAAKQRFNDSPLSTMTIEDARAVIIEANNFNQVQDALLQLADALIRLRDVVKEVVIE